MSIKLESDKIIQVWV